MRSHENTIILMAATIVVAIYAFTQTTPDNLLTGQKQYAEVDGPSTVGPAGGAYKAFSDPKGWGADAKAWHEQHARGGSNWASAQTQTTRFYFYPDPVMVVEPSTK